MRAPGNSDGEPPYPSIKSRDERVVGMGGEVVEFFSNGLKWESGFGLGKWLVFGNGAGDPPYLGINLLEWSEWRRGSVKVNWIGVPF